MGGRSGRCRRRDTGRSSSGLSPFHSPIPANSRRLPQRVHGNGGAARPTARRSGQCVLGGGEQLHLTFSPLAGRSLVQLCLWSGLRLDLDRPPHYEITIESSSSIVALNVEGRSS